MGVRGGWSIDRVDPPLRSAPMTLEQAVAALTRCTAEGGSVVAVQCEAVLLVLDAVKGQARADAELQRKAAERDALVSLLQDVVKAVPR